MLYLISEMMRIMNVSRELDTMSAKQEILDFIENKNMIMSKSVIVFMNALN